MLSHKSWMNLIAEAVEQKSFNIMDPSGSIDPEGSEGIREIDITLLQDEPGPGNSSAEKSGWVIHVRYSVAPDIIVFEQTYPSEDAAKRVYEDFIGLAAEIHGLIKAEQFEKAQEQSDELLKKMDANAEDFSVARDLGEDT